MDKKKFNNEIILCRPAVRKAKVAVIRKLIKRMKILKGCKVEAVKEKKLKKSERMFKKVQMMKKIKVDEVTKFGLRHNDIEEFLRQPNVNLRQRALADLARHKAVMKKINFIREQIQNWETELPILLDSLGKKKRLINKQKAVKSSSRTVEPDVKKMKGDGSGGELQKDLASRVRQSGKAQSKHQSSRTSNDSETSIKENEKVEPIRKIEDPFFIGKKIVAPKLILESLSKTKDTDTSKSEFPLRKRENTSVPVFSKKAFKTKRNSHEFKTQKPVPTTEVEKLHPSWAAKKVKLIKPFQGKKITFSDD